MGRLKQLLPIPDRPAVVRCVETILAAGIAEVILVAGSHAEEITLAVEDFPVTIVYNEDQGSDMAGSVRVGLSRLSIDAERVFVCLCDHPLVSPATLSAMCMHDPGWSDALIIPCHKGHKGHPTLFPRFMLEEVRTHATLRDIIRRHFDKVSLLETDDEGTVLEMDTWEDYQRILGRLTT
jgi:CTP:molybdopterin cytidylyltransferase MocA